MRFKRTAQEIKNKKEEKTQELLTMHAHCATEDRKRTGGVVQRGKEGRT